MKATILGAVAGDTIGSIYEFRPTKDYDFPLLDDRMQYTDDSIMTIAVADWILQGDLTHAALAKTMRHWGNRYKHPMGSYGGRFTAWLENEQMGPYRSWGNGSAMRVSPTGFAFDTLEDTLRYARISAEVTHNHPEGIKGAQATAATVFLARNGSTRADIRTYLSRTFGYRLDRTCAQIRDTYRFDESCQETVPQSLIAFLDSRSYEDAVRLTVSLGGDADTMGAITGAVAAAFYGGIPDTIAAFVLGKLPADLKKVVEDFENRFGVR